MMNIVAIFTVLSSLFVLTSVVSQTCLAQGVPNFGFTSYANNGGTNNNYYNSGLSGRQTRNSFQTGFAGMSSQPVTTAGTHRQYSQQRSNAALQQMLNTVDQATNWNNMPVQRTQPMPMQQQAQAQPQRRGMFPGVSRQEMMRVFFEGGTPMGGGGGGYGAPAPSGNSSAATSTAYSNYQRAENEATKARNAAERSRNRSTSQWNRKDDASQAEYAANNANYAAQRAESAAYSGDSQARGYANLARQAANRARADANRARYNADTMN